MSTVLQLSAKLPFILRALRSRNYRLFFFGQGLSLIGTWMQNVAMGWLVFRLSSDEFKLGLVGFVAAFPNLILGPLSGVIADRWDRRRILLLTQSAALLQAAVLAAMVLTGFVSQPGDVWYLIGMILVLGIINGVDITVRQTFVVELVESREQLTGAISLNSLLMNGSRFLGPPIAGFVVMLWGEGMCFSLNALSYLAVILALTAIKPLPRTTNNNHSHFLHELNEGMRYCWHTPPIRVVLLLLAAMSLLGLPYGVLMPAFAKDVFHGNASTLGFLTGSIGIGAVAGTIYLAAQRSHQRLGKIMALCTIIFALALAAFAGCGAFWDWLSPFLFNCPADALPPNRILWLAGPILAMLGFGQVSQLVAANTFLQIITDEDKRGRVMSLHTVAFLGFAPFGSLLVGWVARHIGPEITVLICGVLCLITAAIFASRLSALRHVLTEKQSPAAPDAPALNQ